MDNSSASSQSRAPRLHYRRRARIYVFPWVPLVMATSLAVASWLIGAQWSAVLLWWGIVAGSYVLLDLATHQSLLTVIVYWAIDKLHLRPRRRTDLDRVRLVFSLEPSPPLFERRHQIRWRLSLAALLATWFLAVYYAGFETEQRLSARAVVTTLLFVYGIVPYGMLVIDPMEYAKKSQKYIIWSSLGAVGALIGPVIFWKLTGQPVMAFLGTLFIFFLYTTVFVSLRFWAGERILNEVIQDISLKFLSLPQAESGLAQVPAVIGRRLQHDCVVLLEPAPEDQQLRVSACYGNERAQGLTIPIEASLTGKVYLEREPVVWNDVSACPYHFRATQDDTRAEMAVPIVHHGEIFGVLDVQSKQKGVYGPEDVSALETIARILGAAIAVHKRNEFFHEAVQLWERVLAASSTMLASEREVFELFSEFMQKMLGADQVVYFPLSLAGCPVHPPYIAGKSATDNPPNFPLSESTHSLTQFIKQWEPRYEPNVVHKSEPGGDEAIKSACFIPIGLRQERLGALVLNYRQHKEFDTIFQFTLLSLAQSLAKITSQVRYRQILYQSFGRPELNLHSIINRHGLKQGVQQKANTMYGVGGERGDPPFSEIALQGFLNQMEDFLQDIYLAESAIPPNFWNHGLEEQLDKYKTTLPPREIGRPRVRFRIDRSVERENPWVRLALYRVVTEAVNNAVFHGEATNISVSIQRATSSIEVRVVNDGLPLPADASTKKSSNGIFVLLDDCHKQLGAFTEIAAGENHVGTVVSISIPTLPDHP